MLPLHSDEELETIGTRFAASDALALLLVEIEPLGRIELRYGFEAYNSSLERLQELIGEVAQEVLPAQDVFVTTERGGDTILLFLFRPRSDREFYTGGLRRLRDQLEVELLQRCVERGRRG